MEDMKKDPKSSSGMGRKTFKLRYLESHYLPFSRDSWLDIDLDVLACYQMRLSLDAFLLHIIKGISVI